MIFFLRFYLFMRDTQREREAETQAEEEAGSMQGAQRGTRSWDPRITPRAEGGPKPLSHPGCPKTFLLMNLNCVQKYFAINEQENLDWIEPHNASVYFRSACRAQWLSICPWPGARSWRPGIESPIGLPAWSLLLPLPVSLPLSVSLMNE